MSEASRRVSMEIEEETEKSERKKKEDIRSLLAIGRD